MVIKSSYSEFEGPTPLTIYHLGPDLNLGPLPAYFYFALSGKESLTLDPFNQPAVYMAEHPVRVFSLTLPGHGEGYTTNTAISLWANELSSGHNIIQEFIENAKETIDYLIDQQVIDPQHLATAGLSRGGFIATHLAASHEKIGALVGYAPMTRLTYLQEFEGVRSHSLDLIHLVDKLVNKKVRFYIGNRDVRVGTEESFKFIEVLTEAGYQAGYRSPSAELIISPSIGHKGHGTPPHIFRDGVEWIYKQLEK